MKISKLVTLDSDLIEQFHVLGGNLSGTLNELLRDHLTKNHEFIKKELEKEKKNNKDSKKRIKFLEKELDKAQKRAEMTKKLAKSSRISQYDHWEPQYA